MPNSTIKPKPCTECGSIWHSKMYHNPRKAIKSNQLQRRHKPLPKPTKRIKMRGKMADTWQRTRKSWMIAYPKIFYNCHYCGTTMLPSELTLDHLIPRSRAPELRFEFDNLVPCCFACNGLKGSVEHDKYPHDCH